jgi:hypothetical protein
VRSNEQLERRHLESVPFSRFQYVDVVFGDADTDVVVEHQLQTTDPEAVNYEVVRADRAGFVYHDQTASRRLWGTGFVLLRSSVADLSVRLRLTLEPL